MAFSSQMAVLKPPVQRDWPAGLSQQKKGRGLLLARIVVPEREDKKRKPRTPEEIAERKAPHRFALSKDLLPLHRQAKQEAEGNPAITPKTLLNVAASHPHSCGC